MADNNAEAGLDLLTKAMTLRERLASWTRMTRCGLSGSKNFTR